MGVTYKLKDEVVRFILNERQGNPLSSCRQLAESASEKFGLRLSKSSVHDVLKECGIVTPRGRKPKDKFQIPQEKKKQIQESLSQVNVTALIPAPEARILLSPHVTFKEDAVILTEEPSMEIKSEASPEYPNAGRIFLKAALWDLGIFSQDPIKEELQKYYLTYAKGIKVILEDQRSFFIEMNVPVERCIREATDGLINNVRPLAVSKVSDQGLFEAVMKAQAGVKMENIVIVDHDNRNLFEISSIVEQIRDYFIKEMLFVENYDILSLKRASALFFPQIVDNNNFIEKILNLNGFDIIGKDELVVNLIAVDIEKDLLQGGIDRLNGLCLYDDQGRSVRVKI